MASRSGPLPRPVLRERGQERKRRSPRLRPPRRTGTTAAPCPPTRHPAGLRRRSLRPAPGRVTGVVLLALLTVVWGSTFVVIQLMEKDPAGAVAPSLLNLSRFALAAILLAPFAGRDTAAVGGRRRAGLLALVRVRIAGDRPAAHDRRPQRVHHLAQRDLRPHAHRPGRPAGPLVRLAGGGNGPGRHRPAQLRRLAAQPRRRLDARHRGHLRRSTSSASSATPAVSPPCRSRRCNSSRSPSSAPPGPRSSARRSRPRAGRPPVASSTWGSSARP